MSASMALASHLVSVQRSASAAAAAGGMNRRLPALGGCAHQLLLPARGTSGPVPRGPTILTFTCANIHTS